jgi:PKHD-type hydroxylase
MRFHVLRLLTPDEARRTAAELAVRNFVDGKATAAGIARDVKQNLQADRATGDFADLDRAVGAALERNEEFRAFAIPRRILAPTFSRYEPGMEYGAHIDSALMGVEQLRTDLAMTLFLSPPECYDGGELAIELPIGEQEIKLDAGEAILYPANTLHRVAPVTRGVRLAAVTWIESCVPDERLREILVDLTRAGRCAAETGRRDLELLVTKSYQNLLRYAAQP